MKHPIVAIEFHLGKFKISNDTSSSYLPDNLGQYDLGNQTPKLLSQWSQVCMALGSTPGLPMSYKLGPRWDGAITWSDFKSEAIFGFLSPNYTGKSA